MPANFQGPVQLLWRQMPAARDEIGCSALAALEI